MLKLSDACEELPPAMRITGIELPGFPVVQGGFADIYKCKWSGSNVAVKRLRIGSNEYSGTEDAELRKVRCGFWDYCPIFMLMGFVGLPSRGVDMVA